MLLRHIVIHKGSFWSKVRALKSFFIILTFCFIFTGCNQISTTSTSVSIPAQTTLPKSTVVLPSPISPTHTSQPVPPTSTTQPSMLVWLPSYLPQKMRSTIQLPDGYDLAASLSDADVSLEGGVGDIFPASPWIYTP